MNGNQSLLKSVSKLLALNLKIIGVSASCIRFLFFIYLVGSTEAPSKVFLLFFLLPDWLKLNHLKTSNGMWFFRHFFAPYLFERSRNNRRYKQPSKFWREKMFRKPHLKLLR